MTPNEISFWKYPLNTLITSRSSLFGLCMQHTLVQLWLTSSSSHNGLRHDSNRIFSWQYFSLCSLNIYWSPGRVWVLLLVLCGSMLWYQNARMNDTSCVHDQTNEYSCMSTNEFCYFVVIWFDMHCTSNMHHHGICWLLSALFGPVVVLKILLRLK
jgi:hypothetical protein